MPQSLSHIYLHIVFSTKGHRRYLDKAIAKQLYAYIAKILHDECHSPARIIGGVEDHIHLLINLARTVSVAHVVEMIKKRSSKWIKTKGNAYRLFQWQTGYSVFSVSKSGVEAVTRYIATQEAHHKKQPYKDELITLLTRHGLEYDEKYLWD